MQGLAAPARRTKLNKLQENLPRSSFQRFENLMLHMSNLYLYSGLLREGISRCRTDHHGRLLESNLVGLSNYSLVLSREWGNGSLS